MAYITISKTNLFNNLQEIEKKVGNKDKIAVVLKDNAYGHGIVEIARLAKEYGIKKAIVKDIQEANQIIDFFDTIVVLSDANQPFDNKLEITINCLEDFDKVPNHTKIHLKIDTGMQRNGIQIPQIQEAFDKIISKQLSLVGVLTHYRSADELNSELFWQVQNFDVAKKIILDLVSKYDMQKPLFHSQASSAVFRMNTHDDFVRVGIALYGYIYLPHCMHTPSLKPVMSLWANKISTRNIKKGSKVGYGGTFVANKDMTISTYDIGYGDGFFRLNEKHKYTTKDGELILGRVSMDSMSIASDKDAICLFDDVTKLANICDTIKYDIVVKLKQSIPKIVV